MGFTKFIKIHNNEAKLNLKCNLMKVKHIISLFIIGTIINKINPLLGLYYTRLGSYGNNLYSLGYGLQILALIFALGKIQSEKLPNFFDF